MASVILGLAVMSTLILTLTRRPPALLRFYCWTQIVHLIAIWTAAWLWGIWNPLYALTYSLFTLPILIVIAGLVWESIEDRPYRLRPLALSFLLALTLARIAFVGLPRGATGYDVVNLVLGGYLAWMGALIGFAAPYARRWDLSLILGLFWIFQAFSSFGWTMNRWRWNWTLDPAGAILAFLLLSWRLHLAPRHGSTSANRLVR